MKDYEGHTFKLNDTTLVTTDHDLIRRWAEERGAHPARVKGTGSRDDPGILRLDFPDDGPDPNLEPIPWEQWFNEFDRRNLAFIYEQQTAGGQRSNFNKLVYVDTLEEFMREHEHELRHDQEQAHAHAHQHGHPHDHLH
jgi:hypothetical protein